MEIMLVIVGIIAIATPIVALVTFLKVQTLERQMITLMQQVTTLSAFPSSALATLDLPETNAVMNTDTEKMKDEVNKQEQPEAQSLPPCRITEHSIITESIMVGESTPLKLRVHQELQPSKLDTHNETISIHSSKWMNELFNRWVAHAKENWMVWSGGISMVVGVAYLIETVGNNFTLPLILRVIIAIALSCSMIGFGEWLHRKICSLDCEFLHQKADAYIPATVYSAGMSGLYGTIIFSAVMHAFIPPTIALVLMAILAIVALALTQRLGPLMAVLGLFGGYSAPIWIGGNEPNFILLTCYISSISIAGIWVQQLTRISWLTYGIIALHSLWLFAIADALPQSQLLLWFVLFIPLSAYLLVFVPQMGWTLRFKCHYRTRAPFFYAAIPAVTLSVISVLLLQNTPNLGWASLIYFLFPMLLLVMPVLRTGRAPKSLSWVSIIAAMSVAVIAISLIHTQIGITLSILGICACMILAVFFRAIGQYWLGDKSAISYWQAIISGPLLVIGSLLYIDYYQPQYRFITMLFVVMCMLLLGGVATKIQMLRANLSAMMHALLFTISVVCSESGVLTLLIAAQILLVTIQYQRHWLTPNLLALKVLGTILVVRLSLLPFLPESQAMVTPQWSWLLCTIIPTLIVFVQVRRLLSDHECSLANWFDAAILHLSVILVFAQTNYLLLGSYNFFDQLEFKNTALFAGQSLALVGVYQFKASISQSLSQIYRGYSLFLMVASMLCIVALNTVFQPFANLDILGSDWPIINWLSIGWLIPALILIMLARFKLYPQPIQGYWLFSAAAGLIALWGIYSIRQFWQTGPLTLDMQTSMAELFSYSVALILVGAAITYYGLQQVQRSVLNIGFITLGIAVCKVFLWDTASLEGLWRAISFMGLGGSLIALGWLFQRSQVNTESNRTGFVAALK